MGFTSSADRLLINVLKALGFLTADGSPTERYFQFLDQSQSGRVLAEGIREAYADLFQLNRNAHTMGKPDLKGKIETLTQGKPSDTVVDKMAMTFQALAKEADWDAPPPAPAPPPEVAEQEAVVGDSSAVDGRPTTEGIPGPSQLPFGGLVYSIQIQLPESRDQAVYDALFRSLKMHLMQ